MFVTEMQKQLPVSVSCDVLVAGGGIAGIAAALAAARQGKRVLLLEKSCMLGGLATSGLVTIYLPLCDGEGRQVSFGIAEELLRLSLRFGAQDRYPTPWLDGGSLEQRKQTRFQVQYNPYEFAFLAEKLLLDSGVTLLYDTRLCEALTDGGRLTHVVIENKSGRSAVAVNAAVDATGDADLCHLACEDTALFAQGNILAAWYYALDCGKNKLKMLGACDVPEKYRAQGEPERLTERRFTGVDAAELTDMLTLSHAHTLADFAKHREMQPEYEIVTAASIPQVRMTRRLQGAFTLDDEQMHTFFADSIGMIGDWRKPGPVYELPFGTLHGSKIENLLAAGRCISVTDPMWDISRVIPACAVTGEAAGIAAAIDGASTDIAALQQKLRTSGVKLHENEL